jgi:DNA-binding response OmpR family regulator
MESQLYKLSRVVDVHVQKLRKGIETDLQNRQHSVTVPCMGSKVQLASAQSKVDKG